MVSTYGYLTLANLEKFTGLDYSVVHPTALADANVEMNITTAEELVNGFLGVSTAQTITNAITVATKFISGWLLNALMDSIGEGVESPNPIFQLSWNQLLDVVRIILAGDADVMVKTVPMSGAEHGLPSRTIL